MSANTKNRGFSLVELLVVIFIFGVIIAIGSTSLLSGFISGRTQSATINALNQNINTAFSFVENQMNNANKKVVISSTNVYGFHTYSDVIVFANSTTGCTYIALYNNALYTKADSACASLYSPAEVASANQQLTSAKITITDFKTSFQDPVSANDVFTQEYTPGSGKPPFLNLLITAKDKKDNQVTSSLKSTFGLTYNSYRNF